MNKKIIITGKAGSGKDHFINHLCKELGLKKEVSYTTRPMRNGEEPGYSYNFVTEEVFHEMREKKQFIECVNFRGWWYGTHHDSWKNSDVFIMTPEGIEHVKEHRNECYIVYLDIPVQNRVERVSRRSDADDTERRIAADYTQFVNFKDWDLRVTDPNFDVKELAIDVLNQIA